MVSGYRSAKTDHDRHDDLSYTSVMRYGTARHTVRVIKALLRGSSTGEALCRGDVVLWSFIDTFCQTVKAQRSAYDRSVRLSHVGVWIGKTVTLLLENENV